MRVMGLAGIRRGKKTITAISNPSVLCAPNKVNREFRVTRPNALAKTINGLYKAEVIWRQRSWQSVSAIEMTTLRWVNRHNEHRCSDPSATFHPTKQRLTTIQPERTSIGLPDSNHTASGKSGTLQPIRLEQSPNCILDRAYC